MSTLFTATIIGFNQATGKGSMIATQTTTPLPMAFDYTTITAPVTAAELNIGTVVTAQPTEGRLGMFDVLAILPEGV